MLSGGNSAAFFTRRRNVVLLATLCCLLWGSAYPAIKGGYALLGIGRGDTAAQLAFAGWRFLLAGGLLLVIARLMGKPVAALAPALQAIARAGFFTPDAQTGQVVILRYKGPQGPEFITLDAGAMIDASRATSAENPLHAQQDVVLEPMDVVYVAPTRIATVADFFSRYVNNIIPLWRNLGFSMVYYTNTVKTRTSGSVTSTPPTNP